MVKKECPSCAVDIDADADICPICGYELPRSKPLLKYVAIILVLLFAWPIIRVIINWLR